MNTIDLFAGAGGSLLTGEFLGWHPVAAVEIDPFCRAVLAHRWPHVELHDNVRTFPAERYVGIDLVTAGFPCQPFSVAGKRLGERDERNLWPATADALRRIRPSLAFLENTAALVAHDYFGRILGDLAEIGFDAEWTVLRASDAGAPHERARLWILAYANGAGERDASQRDRWPQEAAEPHDQPYRRDALRCDPQPELGDANHKPAERLQEREREGRAAPWVGRASLRREASQGGAEELGDADRQGWQRTVGSVDEAGGDSRTRRGEPASASRWQAQPGLGGGAAGMADRAHAPTIWPARRGEAQHAWEPPRVTTERERRRDRLKALGNGWCPQQAAMAFRLLWSRIS